MSDHIFTVTAELSASATCAIPVFIAPYAGYVEKVQIAARTAPIADAGSATTGDINIYIKNETRAVQITSTVDVVGSAALAAFNITLTDTIRDREFSKGDVFTLNQTVSALSAATAMGFVAITFHVRHSRYGGQHPGTFA